MGNQEDPCYKFVEFHPSTTGVMTQKTKSSVEFHPSTEFKPNKESKSLWKSNGADPVNATYVIYLEGNQERYEQVVEQLNQIQPTDTIWIVHNKGYKNCDKGPNIKTPPQDLIDANYEIFKHANQQGYQSILVLEDDFLFDEKLNPNHPESTTIVKNITKFIQSWGDDIPLLYYLGTLPLIQCPWGLLPHNIVFLSSGTHAVIYNRAFRKMLLNEDSTKIKDFDIHMNEFLGMRFSYITPLCYQLFPQTENSNYWGYQHPIMKFLSKIFLNMNMYLFGLDKKIEPGYSFYNTFSKVLFFFLVFLVGFFLWKFMRSIYWILSWPFFYLSGWKRPDDSVPQIRRSLRRRRSAAVH